MSHPTARIWLIALAAVFLVSAISLSGILLLLLRKETLLRNLHLLVSFAVGGLFGDAFIHLLPEAYRSSSGDLRVSFLALAGILVFHVLEGFLLGHFHHGSQRAAKMNPIAAMNLTGDLIHNFIDGLLMGASFCVNLTMGLATTLAIILHEIPQEIGDFAILVHSGLPVRRALAWNFMTSLSAVLGVALAMSVGPRVEGFASAMLPLTAGGFIYIAGSVLIPSLREAARFPVFLQNLSAMAAGIGVMGLLVLFS